jgi:TonB family protein
MSPERQLQHFSSVGQMSLLFNDARFSTHARARSRSTTGLWLSVVVHATIAGVLIGVVPTRASEKSSAPRLRSITVFRMPTEPATLKLIPVVAPPRPAPLLPTRQVHETVIPEPPKPVAVAPIATRSVEPVPATLPPAALPAFERPVAAAVAAIQRPPETGLFERANGPRTSQPVTAITTGAFGSVAVSSRGAVNDAEVRVAGFDRTASAPVQPSVAVTKPIERPVEIVFKPSPEYTDDARSARIEGTVTLDLEFSAAGDVRVLRVVRGLGHGLDEAAERAALRIRFKPAQSEGRAVDSRATVYITFRLS